MKKRMKIQHRYIRFICYVLRNEPLETIHRYATRFAELYSKKHNGTDMLL